MTSYQTVPLPDGDKIVGLFPTIEWFEAIARHVDFKNTMVLDVGSCSFSYGIQAINKGATFVTGIEYQDKWVNDSERLLKLWGMENGAVVKMVAEAYRPNLPYTVMIFSMIIHWLHEPQLMIQRYLKNAERWVVFIYRYPQEKEEDGWHPTLSELNLVVGMEPMHHEFLSQSEEQNIKLVIYDKDGVST